MRDSQRHWLVALPLAALAAVVLLVLAEALRPGRTLYERDLHLVVLAHTEVFARCIAAHAWPVWNRALGFGEPLWAIPSAQVVYPPHWLNLVIQPWTYFTVSGVGHLVLGGAGVFACLRRWGASAVAAWFGGALWCVSGPVLSSLTYWNHFCGFAWLPWTASTAMAAFEQPSVGRALAWGLTIAMTVLAGSPDAAVMAGAITVAVIAAQPWAPAPLLRRQAACAIGAAAFSILLSAAQWLPTLELARRSVRTDISATGRLMWSVAPAVLAEVVLPVRPDRWPLEAAIKDDWFEGREPFLASLYLGLSSLPLVALGVLSLPRRRALALSGLFVAAGIAALGRHTVVSAFFWSLPPLSALRYPAKAMIVATFAWSLLGGMGVAALAHVAGMTSRRWRGLLWLAGITPLLGFVASLALARLGQAPADSVLVAEAVTLAVAALGALLVVLLLLAARRGRPFPAILALVPVLELALLHRGLNPTAPVELLRLRPPLADLILRSPHGRVYSYDYLIWQNAARRHLGHDGLLLREAPVPWAGTLALRTMLYPHVMGAWGLESAFERDSHGLQTREIAALAELLRQAEGTPGHLRLLQLASVTHVIALHDSTFRDLALLETVAGPFREPLRVFAVPDPLPRTYVVSSARHHVGSAAARAALVDSGFDIRREVLIDAAVGAGAPAAAAAPLHTTAGTSQVVEESPDRIVIDADLERAGYVVISDAYDPGWQVRVDGRRAPLLRANLGFRAVAVPAGQHRIVHTYRPPSLLVGAALSLLAALLAGAFGCVVLASPRRDAAA